MPYPLLPFFVARKKEIMNWKDKTLYERIVDRWEEKESDYSKINRNRETIIAYFRSDELLNIDDKGNFLGQDIYNGSGAWYARMMATGFQGSLVSKNIDWFRYQMAQYELQGIDRLDAWCQDIKDYMTDVYHRSNFYDVQPQFTIDGLTTGSPVMFADENIKKRKTIWKPQYYKTVRLYYDGDNEIEGVIVRDTRWTAKQLFDTFVKEDNGDGTRRKEKLSREVNKALEDGRLNAEFTVYRAVFRADDAIWKGGWKKPKGEWKWLSVFLLELNDVDRDKRNTPLNENVGYFSQPFAHWDFDKKPWEISSRTPAFYAIWDCMGLQEVYKNFLENIQLKNRPPRFALNSMKGRLRFSPEGEILVTDQEYEKPPKALDLIGDVELTKDLSTLYEDALKRWFYIDRFQMFSDLINKSKQPVTATQIYQMAGEKSTLLSPAIETHSRFLESCDDRMMNIESTAGRGPFAPDVLVEISEIVLAKTPVGSISVMPVFIGALAQAQKRNQALEPIQSTIAAAIPLLEIFPELRMAIREYETLDDMFQAFDFPQKNIVPKEDYEKAVALLSEKQAKDDQLAKLLEIAKASKDVSGPVDENSVLASMAGAAG